MVRVLSKVGFAALFMLAFAFFTQQAKADSADFYCSSTAACNGTVAVSGGNYSSTSITMNAGSYSFDTEEVGESFTLAFDTSTGMISLTDTTDGDATLTGTIVNFSAHTFNSQTTVTLDVNWTSPAGFYGIGTVGFVLNQNNAANSVDVSVLPTPEPASLMLLGTGLLGMGAAVRRRLFS